MNIQKNISNRLKMFQAKTGLNTMECAKALGISKSSLQDYKDGKRLPRADTLELIADSMGISVADLISDCDNPIQDAFSDAWQNLHPLLRPVAEAQIQELVRLSNEIYALEQRLAEKGGENGTYQYTFFSAKDASRSRISYGLFVKEWRGDAWHAVAAVAPFSEDCAAVFDLTQYCAKLQIPPDRMMEVVEDFLAGRIRHL